MVAVKNLNAQATLENMCVTFIYPLVIGNIYKCDWSNIHFDIVQWNCFENVTNYIITYDVSIVTGKISKSKGLLFIQATGSQNQIISSSVHVDMHCVIWYTNGCIFKLCLIY